MGIGDWGQFFSAELAAAAALTGLLFVALSINLQRIVSVSGLPERAAITLSLLVAVVIVATLCLVPGQPRIVLGGELLVFGIALTIFVYAMRAHYSRSDAAKLSPVPVWVSESANVLTTVPIIVAGVLEILGIPGALYFLASQVVTSFIVAAVNAWVLLVEIVR
jgi:hypothetical protein